MPKYRYIPKEIEAVQFTGKNWLEVFNFCGTRKDGDGYDIPIFNRVGTFLLEMFSEGAMAELWISKYDKYTYVHIGDYIVKTEEEGFTTVKEELFSKFYEKIKDSHGD